MFDFLKDHHDAVYGPGAEGHHKASLSHEVLGGAVAFFAMRAYEEHQAKLGQPVSHGFAKAALAAIAGAEIDRLAETRGMDAITKEKAKHHAIEQANAQYDAKYGGQEQGDGVPFDAAQFAPSRQY